MNMVRHAVDRLVSHSKEDNLSVYGRWSERYWNGYLKYDGRDYGLSKRLTTRLALIQRIDKCLTSRGTIFVEEYGQDCDGVRYHGKVGEEKISTWRAFEKYREENLAWADGPMFFAILTEEQARKTRYYSVDTFAAAAGY